MGINEMVKNIVYVDYTSTSRECAYSDDSNRPDSLLNIMRDNVIIIDSNPPENISSEKNNQHKFL
jgi:hypothetical protein